MDVVMLLRKHVCAALAMVLMTSCATRDAKEINASSSPNCEQSKATDDKAADEDHVLEKVGRTVFWLEIKLLEQNKKTSSQCRSPQ